MFILGHGGWIARHDHDDRLRKHGRKLFIWIIKSRIDAAASLVSNGVAARPMSEFPFEPAFIAPCQF
jgi:hypothetical protein